LDDLVKREGLYYENSTDEPFTGKVDEGLARGEIKNGKQEGPWVQYHDDGQIYWKGAYKNGKREGPWVHYDVHGTKVRDRTGTYRNGVKVSD